MAGFARKFPFSECRATMRTWSCGVGLLLLVASGVPNVVFVDEIVRQRGRYLLYYRPASKYVVAEVPAVPRSTNLMGTAATRAKLDLLFHQEPNLAELRSAGQPRAAVPTWFVPLPCYAALLGFLLGNVAQQDVAGRNQAFEFLAIHDGQMAKAKFLHEVKTVFNSFFHADRFGIGRHHF